MLMQYRLHRFKAIHGIRAPLGVLEQTPNS